MRVAVLARSCSEAALAALACGTATGRRSRRSAAASTRGDVVVVDEVGAVAAAALHELGRRPGEHALAAVRRRCTSTRQEERDVEDPGAVLVGIVERQPLVEVVGHGLGAGMRRAALRRYRQDPMSRCVVSMTCATRSAPDRVRDRCRLELGLYRRDASDMAAAAGVVCFPLSTAEVQACVRVAAPPRPAVRGPRLGYGIGRRRGAGR